MSNIETYSAAERTADAVIHVVGVMGGVVAGAWLVARGFSSGDDARLLSFSVYAAGMVAMFVASMSYNLVDGRPKALLRRLDHAAIFLMIAGTYTPYAALRFEDGIWNPVGVAVWLGAVAGAVAKLCVPSRFERWAIPCYLALGWAVLGEISPLQAALSPLSFGLLVAGGLLYTVGVPVCLMRRLPFHNALWHAFVLAAAGCHFVSIAVEFA